MSNPNPYRDDVDRKYSGPIRTAVQLLPSAVIVEFIDAFLWDMNDRQYGALGALLLMVVSIGQNYIESKKKVAFLR